MCHETSLALYAYAPVFWHLRRYIFVTPLQIREPSAETDEFHGQDGGLVLHIEDRD